MTSLKRLFLKSEIKPRGYQQRIFANSINKNSLIILPTGLGKTLIALMLAVYYFNKDNRKILFLAPTKPLVEQQKEAFKEFLQNSNEIILTVLTGQIRPEKRTEQYKKSDFIFSTPQLIENDIVNKRIEPKDFGLVIFDEAHRATGNYAYTFIAEIFSKHSNLVGLTASPGTTKEEILEIISKLYIEHIEIRRIDDIDIKKYVNNIEINKIYIELPDEIRNLLNLLKKIYVEKLNLLKKEGFFQGKNPSNITKKDLLLAQKELREKIFSKQNEQNDWIYLSTLAALLKLTHGIELIETQGIEGSYEYFYNFFKTNGDRTKAAESLVRDINFRTAFEILSKLHRQKITHPKIKKLKKLVIKEILNNSELKQIIFTQYRTTAERIVSELSEYKELRPVLFIGQTKKGDVGMSQKEQKNVLTEFRDGKYNILVSTSVGEEGLDIPKVDQVIFYEPIPSAIRTIQRIGRTGRFNQGRVIMLITVDTRDEIFSYVSRAKEKRMYKILDEVKKELELRNKKTKMDTLKKFIKVEDNSKSEKKDNKEKNLKEDISTNKNDTYNEEINTKKTIIIDSRENNTLIKHMYRIPDIEIKVQNLDIGDILINDKICIERKSTKDFVNSIIDKRLFAQLFNLARNYIRPILIIEGTENIYSIRDLNPNVILSTLGTIAGKLRIPIIYTRTTEETAQLIRILSKKEETYNNVHQINNKKTLSESEELLQFVSTIPTINVINAQRLLKKFKTIKNLVSATKKELKEVEGIGEVRAENIFNFFRKEYNF